MLTLRGEAEGVQVALDAVMDFNAQLSNQYYFQVGYPPSNLRYQRAIQQLDAIGRIRFKDEKLLLR